MALTLPRSILLEPIDKLGFLSYVRGGGYGDGFLKFSESQAVSPYAQFEVEFTDTNGVVHIRSCKNNKYWERTQKPYNNTSTYWITATAKKKEDDKSKGSCTLFKFISVNSSMKTVRIMHLQSGCYLYLWRRSSDIAFDRCMMAGSTYPDVNNSDVFRLIDWSSLLILPKYLAFKGDNNKYYCLRHFDSRRPYIQSSCDDLGDPTVACEVSYTNDGNLRFKQLCNGKFWRGQPNWIWADSNDTAGNDKATLFRAVKVDDTTIGLINVGNNRFCRRYTAEGKQSCLKTEPPYSITKEARLTVVEPVLKREIYDLRYDLNNARVYGETLQFVGEGTDENTGNVNSELSVKIKYEYEKTTTWKAMFSLNIAAKAKAQVGIPVIAEAKVAISSEIKAGIEWNKTERSTTSFSAERKTVVPPRTKVTVKALKTQGSCDVPFTYMQKDTLYDGRLVTTQCHGIFTGANCYGSIQYKDAYQQLN